MVTRAIGCDWKKAHREVDPKVFAFGVLRFVVLSPDLIKEKKAEVDAIIESSDLSIS